jgi:hypothetical protein
MGLLDDAIREHLELKRRRGDDPALIERAEREPLGPVRREPAADEPLPDLPADEAPAGEEAPTAEPAAPAGEPDFDWQDSPSEPVAGPQETHEYDVEAALEEEHGEPGASQEGAESEDVLEETPEFLQETPEHDRLWFEQRPPRDFDFDG